MEYWVYGFPLSSQFELPELRPANNGTGSVSAPPRVEIVEGAVPTALPGETRVWPWTTYAGGTCLYNFPGLARFAVEDGVRITVEMEPGTAESDLRAYLLGSGLGTILHQRGITPLHVSAVLTPEGAIAFTGPSGAGKSTLATSLNAELGYPIVTDDVAAMTVTEDGVFIEGGVYRTRLWKDALDRFEIPVDGLQRDLLRQDKYQLILPDRFVDGPQRLLALVELDPSGTEPWRHLKSAESLSCFVRSVYRPFLLRPFQDERTAISDIARACALVHVSRNSSYRTEKGLSIISRALLV